MAGRVTQTPLEVVVLPTTAAAATTMIARATLILPDDAVARTTQVTRLVLIDTNTPEPSGTARSYGVIIV